MLKYLVVLSCQNYYFPGNNTDSWAANLDSREFQLLCSQESRAEVTQYTKCNLARVPSHAVMIRPDINHHIIFGLLDKAQVAYAKCHFFRVIWKWRCDFLVCIFQNFFGVNAASGFKMFDSKAYEGSDLIFKDSTITLIGVGEKKTYEEWLGQSYLDAVIAMECSATSTGTANLHIGQYFFVILCVSHCLSLILLLSTSLLFVCMYTISN